MGLDFCVIDSPIFFPPEIVFRKQARDTHRLTHSFKAVDVRLKMVLFAKETLPIFAGFLKNELLNGLQIFLFFCFVGIFFPLLFLLIFPSKNEIAAYCH